MGEWFFVSIITAIAIVATGFRLYNENVSLKGWGMVMFTLVMVNIWTRLTMLL